MIHVFMFIIVAAEPVFNVWVMFLCLMDEGMSCHCHRLISDE